MTGVSTPVVSTSSCTVGILKPHLREQTQHGGPEPSASGSMDVTSWSTDITCKKLEARPDAVTPLSMTWDKALHLSESQFTPMSRVVI